MNSKLKIAPETPVTAYDDSSCKMSLCSFSVAGIVTWNDDVLIEILLWLPAKSLTRFKLVCKHWLSLISAHEFCRLHTLRHPKSQPSLILRAPNSHFFYFYPILNSPKLIPYSFSVPNPKILSSCNGLLLLQSNDPEKDFYVYNPTTKQSRRIILTNSDNYTNIMGINLAFDPSKSPHYKIVCVRRTSSSDHEQCYKFEVYDSESRTWKLCSTPLRSPIELNFSSGVNWNNVIHWDNHPFTRLYLDIDKNVIKNLPHAVMPGRGGEEGAAFSCQLQESNGHLYHFIIASYRGDKAIAVYELKEDYSQWLFKYSSVFCALPGKFHMLSFIRADDRETGTLVIHVVGKIIAYRFLDKICEELIDLTNQPFYQEDSVQFDSKDVYRFGETLAPV